MILRHGVFLQNRYEILELIGSGGMSEVYRARCHKLNRFVAIKLLKKEFCQDEEFVRKFKMEAQAAAGLNHPNIVSIYDVVDEDDLHYIVMELVEGITLKEYITKKGHLDIKESIGIAVQVAQGIGAAHQRGIIHRDVKPQNMILAGDGKVKVADFGIARAVTAQTISSQAMGSVHYISPEQARGEFTDARSDIYSLGITMYEMVTGKLPFNGDTAVSVALAHIEETMVPPETYNPAIPKSLEQIIIKCAEKDPETEISTAEKLESFRKMQPHYMGPSFDTISSWGYHAAIVHYSATEETDIPLQSHSFLLVDSGGQYLEGTTDITRTFVLGALTREEKEYFTRVLKGHLNLADCRFKYGCTGTAFDYVARRPLWEIGKDYNHGTGHGVGFCLNVHEGPNSFSYKTMQGRRTPAVFEEGMVTSDEPGFYLEGKFGIRHENLLLCRNDYENEYGRFMKFEYLTMVPFDLDGLLPELMTEYEIGLLNSYHAMVFEKISPWLKGDELEWLKYATRAI